MFSSIISAMERNNNNNNVNAKRIVDEGRRNARKLYVLTYVNKVD